MINREELMAKCRKDIDEAEQERTEDLCMLKKDGYTHSYVKIEDLYVVYKRFYDLSRCTKEWFEKNYKERSIPFITARYDETEDPLYPIEITYEEYLKAKEEAIIQYPDSILASHKRRDAFNKACEENLTANDGKDGYRVTFIYNTYIGETIYVRANSEEEAKELATIKHAEFTKDWVYPEAYKYGSCKAFKL